MLSEFKNAAIVVGSTRTTLYTSPISSQAVINALYLTNVTGIWASVSIQVAIGDNSFYLAKDIPVPTGACLILDKPINMTSGDQISVTASVGSTVHAYASVLEIS